MNFNTCPNCEERVLSFWSKLSIGPLRSKKCDKCGARFGVGKLQSFFFLILAQLAFIFGGVGALETIKGISFSWFGAITAIFTIGGVLASLIVLYGYYRYVPLVSKDA